MISKISLPSILLLATTLVAGCSEPVERPISVTTVTSPAVANSAEPHLARGPDGTIVLSWLEGDRDAATLRYAVLNDGQWLPARTIVSGDNWFVNWADFPSVTPISDNLWAAHWLVKRPGNTYSYDVAIALSQDSGQTWSEPITPHDDGTATEHGFVSLFPWQDGVGAVWLDGRNMIGGGHDGGHATGDSGGMTLRSVVVAPDQQLLHPQLVDDLVCDCCQTDVVVGPNGPLAVYRDRTTEEIRDIYIARVVDGQWQPGQPVAQDEWKIAGCPVNGPAIAASQLNVAVAWYSGANNAPGVYVTTSTDNGDSFSQPIVVDAGQPVGRVDVELLPDGDAVVSWLRTTANEEGEISIRRVSREGKVGPDHVIAKTNTSRLSGFPQMILNGKELVFAWTDVSNDEPSVQTALVDISSFH